MGYVAQSIGQWKTDWTPVLTGFSANPTGGTPAYTLIGKTCHCYCNDTTNGTSNSTTKTITLPFAAANNGIQIVTGRGIDNGSATSTLYVRTIAGSNIADVFPTSGLGVWTASGACRFLFSMTFQTL